MAKILIIEDNLKHIESLTKSLEGHELTVFNDAMTFCKKMEDSGRVYYCYERGEFDFSKFDIVVTDIHIPAPTDRGGIMEGPIGLMIALKAILEGVSGVIIITDTGHHDANPIAKAMDWFQPQHWKSSGKTKVATDSTFGGKKEVPKDALDWILSNDQCNYMEWCEKNQK